MKEIIFVIAGSFHQFKEYCKYKGFKLLKEDIHEDKDGNEIRYARGKRDLSGREIKKIIEVGTYWESNVLGDVSEEWLEQIFHTTVERDFY
ncbi:MAG: hypothetical protein WC346_21315 [Methanogenium sp.]|jgi:nitrate reductase beta subunit